MSAENAPIHSAEAVPQTPQALVTPFGLVILGVAAALLGILAWTAYDKQSDRREGQQATDFSLPLLLGEGDFSLSAQHGKVVVINFWGSWCAPCRAEAPLLQSIYADYKDRGVVFVGVAVDDTEKAAKTFLETYAINYPTVLDNHREVENAYQIFGVPETYVIGKNGKISHYFPAQPSESELRDALEKALKE